MPAIMPTLKLWRHWGQKTPLPAHEDVPQNSVLGDWTANLIPLLGDEFILYGNSRTVLTILGPTGPLDYCLEAFRHGLRRELERLEIPQTLVTEEIRALESAKLSKNNDRSLLGSMNDLAWHYADATQSAYQTGQLDLDAIQTQMNRVPHVKRDPSYAEDAVRRLFAH